MSPLRKPCIHEFHKQNVPTKYVPAKERDASFLSAYPRKEFINTVGATVQRNTYQPWKWWTQVSSLRNPRKMVSSHNEDINR